MPSQRHSSGRIFWGLVLILLGVLFLLDQMGRVDFGDLISGWWPLILVAAGVWQLISSNFRELTGGLFLIALGALFQLAKLEILGRDAWHYVWPALIIGLGLWVLIGAFRRSSAARLPGSKEDELDAFAIFAGLNRRIESQSFRGGKATAIMGGIELDLAPTLLVVRCMPDGIAALHTPELVLGAVYQGRLLEGAGWGEAVRWDLGARRIEAILEVLLDQGRSAGRDRGRHARA
jgi:hypothetical protein